MMIVYQLDSNGVYCGEAVAHESPLEPGVFHSPAGCVETSPPSIEHGHAAVYRDGAWMIVPDHRGETWYDAQTGAAVVIATVGELPANLQVTPPAPTAIEQAHETLRSLDVVLPRIAEDLIDAIGVTESSLPEIVQTRLVAKRAARAVIRGEEV